MSEIVGLLPASDTHTHTHPFNGLLCGTTRVSQYQNGKTNLDSIETRNSQWQWHQLGHMQVCTSLQTDNRAILIIKSSLPKEVEEEDSGDPAGAGSLGKWSW